jgi:hypothetical protein
MGRDCPPCGNVPRRLRQATRVCNRVAVSSASSTSSSLKSSRLGPIRRNRKRERSTIMDTASSPWTARFSGLVEDALRGTPASPFAHCARSACAATGTSSLLKKQGTGGSPASQRRVLAPCGRSFSGEGTSGGAYSAALEHPADFRHSDREGHGRPIKWALVNEQSWGHEEASVFAANAARSVRVRNASRSPERRTE